jgi:hypothetical protein
MIQIGRFWSDYYARRRIPLRAVTAAQRVEIAVRARRIAKVRETRKSAARRS